MQEKCPVCKNNIKVNDKACSVCGFADLHREFITKEDGELWIKNVVEPYKKQYEASKKPVLDDGFGSNGYNKDGFDRDGSIKEVNESQEIIELKRRANLGDAVAQNDLGMCYKYGKGVHKDINKAIYYYEQAIENGCNVAAHNLACVYDKTTPENPNDYEKAFKYYKLAEETGYSDGVLFNNLGRLYADGKGVETNYEMAKKYYEKAVSMGNSTARNNLNILNDVISASRYEVQNKNLGKISAVKTSSKEPNFLERNSDNLIWGIIGIILFVLGGALMISFEKEIGGFLGFVAMLGGIFFTIGGLSSLK